MSFLLNSAYLSAWAQCPTVGLAVTGDPALIDAHWPEILSYAGDIRRLSPGMDPAVLSEPVATAAIAAGDAFTPEQAAAIRADRVLVRAASLETLPSALVDATPLILELGTESSPTLIRRLLTSSNSAAQPPKNAVSITEPPAAEILAMLDAAGLSAARLDVPACQFAAALGSLGATEAEILQGVFDLVVAPRTELLEPPAPPPPPPPEHSEGAEPPEPSEATSTPEDTPPQEADPPVAAPPMPKPGRARGMSWPGRGGAQERSSRRGRVRRTEHLRGDAPLAILPTLAAAAPWQPARRLEGSDSRVIVTRDDLRTQQRVTRGGGLAIIVVDASGSMGLGAIRIAKSIALGVLDQGYRNRDRVAIVVVRGGSAYVGLPPTKSVSRARDCVRSLPTGGGTPLASGLLLAARIASQHPPERVRSIVLSDGGANVGLHGTGKDQAREDARLAFSQLEQCSAVQILPLNSGRSRRHSTGFAWLTTQN